MCREVHTEEMKALLFIRETILQRYECASIPQQIDVKVEDKIFKAKFWRDTVTTMDLEISIHLYFQCRECYISLFGVEKVFSERIFLLWITEVAAYAENKRIFLQELFRKAQTIKIWRF